MIIGLVPKFLNLWCLRAHQYSFRKAVTHVWRGISEFMYLYGSYVESDDAVIPSCCCCNHFERMDVITKLAESPRTANKAVDELCYRQGVDYSNIDQEKLLHSSTNTFCRSTFLNISWIRMIVKNKNTQQNKLIKKRWFKIE